MCEYSHAMGNSNGTLADHWAAIESTPGLQGGFIWEFWDHGMLQRVNDGNRPGPARRAGRQRRRGAGPPLGVRRRLRRDDPNDGVFCADGVVFPDRTPKPAMYEHREIAAPVRLRTTATGCWRATIDQHFRGLDWLAGRVVAQRLADGGTPRRRPSCPPYGRAARHPCRVPADLLAALPERRGLADAAGDDGARRKLG